MMKIDKFGQGLDLSPPNSSINEGGNRAFMGFEKSERTQRSFFGFWSENPKKCNGAFFGF